ncbi:hypothetical protein [Flectobacillus major]|jgi:hypothetical protein|uniref:hypothetical protein n=1 Tax=Flectobacillus major TaxID=103 RepID=UPI0004024E63|nr:hypothetical protein [Flectobacillus major]
MSNDNEELKPLSFDEADDTLKPLNFDTKQQDNTDFVPLAKPNSNELKNKDSNFVLFFGSASSGKSVILSSMLYFLNSQAGVLRPNLSTPNSRDAMILLSDFFDNIRKGIFPNRTTKDQVTRLDFIFEPNNKSKKVPPINLTFLETAGDNNYEIRRGGKFHSSIDTYLSAKIPLTIIIVTSRDNAHKEDTFIYEFLNELHKKEKTLQSINIILVISKWDKSGKLEVAHTNELDEFIADNLPITNKAIDTYEFSKSFYTIGELTSINGEERIKILSLATAEVLSKWLYRSIVGYDLDYEGTFWERIKFSIKNS